MPDLRYPIGPFSFDADITEAKRQAWVKDIEEAPARLRAAVAGLSSEQLDTRYREGGWTVRQVVHHVADSHLNGYVRFRLAVTEEKPLVKTYLESRWAELADARTAPVEVSLLLIDSLHERWALLLRSLSSAEFAREFQHPERGVLTLDANLQLYSWHGRHHVAHIVSLRERMGWV